ncbi:MAG TPA: hypothetical protein VK420_22795, partial [Longimicrobium sp.]|nr:hypothetical protein [Longimicrobium sp.]
HLMHLPSPHTIYLGVDREPADSCEVLHWLAATLAQPAPRRAEEAVPPRGNKRCRSDRLASSGYTLLYPTYRDGFAALLSTSTTS